MTLTAMADERPIGLAPLGFLDLAPAQFIRTAARAGFRSVGLRAQAAVAGGAQYPLVAGSADLDAIREAIAETGVAVDVIEVISLHRQVHIADLESMLRCASVIGASRVLCTGDDVDLGAVASKFAELCDLAHSVGMSAHLEFMRFRTGVQTLADAMQIVRQANRLNGFVAVDILHLIRSGGSVQSLGHLPLDRVGIVQLCDGPLLAPPDTGLAEEARHNRLPPGEGEFPIAELLAMLPAHIGLDVEVPLSGARAGWSHDERASLLYTATRDFLRRHASSGATSGPGRVKPPKG